MNYQQVYGLISLKLESDKHIFAKTPEIRKDEYFYAEGSIAPHKNYKQKHEMAKTLHIQLVVPGNINMKNCGIDNWL